MTKQADLIAYLFEGQPRLPGNSLAGELLGWMEASTPFTAFVETYRDKIRKKIRVSREPETLLDLRSELEVACRLLSDPRLGPERGRLAVAYEPYASAKTRGPDFSVTYRANLVFNIEVARLRGEETRSPAEGPQHQGEATHMRDEGSQPPEGETRPRGEERVQRILLNKLGQMQPGMANLLVIHTRAGLARAIDLARRMQELKTRVEAKDPAFYAASRYPSPAAFYKDFAHLSAIVLWAEEPPGAEGSPAEAQLWMNKQARPLLDEKLARRVALALQERAMTSDRPG